MAGCGSLSSIIEIQSPPFLNERNVRRSGFCGALPARLPRRSSKTPLLQTSLSFQKQRLLHTRCCSNTSLLPPATTSSLRLDEVLQRVSFAIGLRNGRFDNHYTITGRQRCFGLEGMWRLTWCLDGLFYENFSGHEMVIEYGYDGRRCPWHADAGGRVTELELDNLEACLLVQWVRTGFWLTEKGRKKLSIRKLEKNRGSHEENKLWLVICLKDKKVEGHVLVDSNSWLPIQMEVKAFGGTERWEFAEWQNIAPRIGFKFAMSTTYSPAAGGKHTYSAGIDCYVHAEDGAEYCVYTYPSTPLVPRYTECYPRIRLDSACSPSAKLVKENYGNESAICYRYFAGSALSNYCWCFYVVPMHRGDDPSTTMNLLFTTNTLLELLNLTTIGGFMWFPCVEKMIRARSGHHLVCPLIDGQDMGYFIVDTGASGLVISGKKANEVDMKAFGEVFITGVEGKFQTRFRRGKNLQLGPLLIEYPVFIEAPSDDVVKGVTEPVSGILGYDIFCQSIVEMSSAEFRMSFYDPMLYKAVKPGPKRWDALYMLDNTPHTEAKFSQHSALLMLDTGAGGLDIIFHKRAVEEFNLLPPLLDVKGGHVEISGLGTSGGGGIRVQYGTLSTVEVAGQVFHEVKTLYFTADEQSLDISIYTSGILCGQIILHQLVVFDYPNRRFAFVSS